MAAEKKPDTLPRILVVRNCGGWVSEIDMHCRLFSNAAMQLENHVLVMCIALRQLWGNWPVHACRTMAIEVLLRSLARSILGSHSIMARTLGDHTSFSNGTCAASCRRGNKNHQLLGMLRGPQFLILGIAILLEKKMNPTHAGKVGLGLQTAGRLPGSL